MINAAEAQTLTNGSSPTYQMLSAIESRIKTSAEVGLSSTCFNFDGYNEKHVTEVKSKLLSEGYKLKPEYDGMSFQRISWK